MSALIILILLSFSVQETASDLFLASKSNIQGDIILFSGEEGWRFQGGDNLLWADPEFDDSDWLNLQASGMTEPIADSLWNGYGWFRFTFVADSTMYNKVWNLYFFTWGAAEVYLDGEKIHDYGRFSTNPEDEVNFSPESKLLLPILLSPQETHTIAVRFSYHKAQKYYNLIGSRAANFGFGIGVATQDWNDRILSTKYIGLRTSYISSSILFLITLLHGFLFYLFREEKANLFIAAITLMLGLHSVLSFGLFHFEFDRLWSFLLIQSTFWFLVFGSLSLIPYTIVRLLDLDIFKWSKYLPFITLLAIPSVDPRFFAQYVWYGLSVIPAVFLSVFVLVLYLLYVAWKLKRSGIWYVAGGFVGILFFATSLLMIDLLSLFDNWALEAFLITMMYVSIPIGMTLFMAHRLAHLYSGLETEVIERTRALSTSLVELEAAQEQLIQQEKLASLGQLTAGIAHEIKNPLNFVNNFSEVSIEMIDEIREEVKSLRPSLKPDPEKSPFEGGKVPIYRNQGDVTEPGFASNPDSILEILDDIEANLRKIHQHGTRADGIVKSMLLHSRGGSGKMEPNNLNSIVKEYVNLAFHGMRASKNPINVDIQMDLDETIGDVPMIAEDFSRVILNLCNNAFDAMRDKLTENGGPKTEKKSLRQPAEGKVPIHRNQGDVSSTGYHPKLSIRTQKSDDGITIEIEDNGPGIPNEIKDKILQPFFTTKKGTQGTGLGLSITHDIIKAHGGSVEIKSEPGKTIFKIKFNL